MTQTLEERVHALEARVEQLECELDQACADMQANDDRVAQRIATLSSVPTAARRRSKPAGGQYRDDLLQIFEAHPTTYFRPSALAKQLGLEWRFQVPVAQACKGLVAEGRLESRAHYETKRPEYRKRL